MKKDSVLHTTLIFETEDIENSLAPPTFMPIFINLFRILTRGILTRQKHNITAARGENNFFLISILYCHLCWHLYMLAPSATREPVLYLFFQPNHVSILLSQQIFCPILIESQTNINKDIALLRKRLSKWKSMKTARNDNNDKDQYSYSLYLTDNGHICIIYHWIGVCMLLNYSIILKQQLICLFDSNICRKSVNTVITTTRFNYQNKILST